jgi:glutathione S-transferase
MKLYYSPGACSLAPHIILREAGLPFDLVQVDLKAKQTKDGGDFTKVNPKGQVPTLQLDDGQILTENVAIDQYLADQKPDSGLLAQSGLERYRGLEWLVFVSTELHKAFSPLFRPTTPDEYKRISRENIAKKFDYVEQRLADGRQYLMGDRFTAPDAYLFTVLRWAKAMNMDMSPWPKLAAYRDRVAGRPKVQETLKAEGLA